jgi:hypothetical protein
MVEPDREADLARIAAEEKKVRDVRAAREQQDRERRQAQGRIERGR